MANKEDLILIKSKTAYQWNNYRESSQGKNIDLTGADLSNMDLTNMNLNEANLCGANFTNTNLTNANLAAAKTAGADFTNSILVGVSFRMKTAPFREESFPIDFSTTKMTGANISGLDFQYAKLDRHDFMGMNLSNVNFSNATLRGADLRQTDLTETNFFKTDMTGVDLRLVKNLTQDQVNKFKFDPKIPPQLTNDLVLPGQQSENGNENNTHHILKASISYKIIKPANEILKAIPIPNDDTNENIALMSEFRNRLMKLEKIMVDTPPEMDVSKTINEEKIFWMKVWQNFILHNTAKIGGNVTTFTVGYSIGYLAGSLHDAFEPTSIWV